MQLSFNFRYLSNTFLVSIILMPTLSLSFSDESIPRTVTRSQLACNTNTTWSPTASGINPDNKEEEIEHLTRVAEHLIESSIASSTQHQYRSSMFRYIKFCSRLDLIAYPLHQPNMILFATELASTLSYSAINIHLAGIKFYAHKYGYTSDFTQFKRLYLLLRGVKKSESF